MYKKYLKQIGQPESFMSRSSHLRLLDTCVAHPRRSLSGLDPISQRGKNAYDDIVDMLKNHVALQPGEARKVDKLIRQLKESKQYLASDYGLRIKMASKSADHCMNFR